VAHARANVPAHGPQTQLDRHLKPRSAAELHDAYAVTDGHAASDPARITATRTGDGGWRIDGEKWFVTYGDVAQVYIVMAKALVDGGELPTLFLVERGTPGIEVIDDPPFTHSYPHGHSDAALHRCGGSRGGDRRRPRRRRGPAARLVRRGAPMGIAHRGAGPCGG
jgi:alkylation response protein AidB-like acyl-CoA dehydrogenase